METTSIRADEINREWFIVDAEGQTLGRLASEIAQLIRGKKKPFYTPHQDMGDFVVVVNAEKVKVTGNKEKDKEDPLQTDVCVPETCVFICTWKWKELHKRKRQKNHGKTNKKDKKEKTIKTK